MSTPENIDTSNFIDTSLKSDLITFEKDYYTLTKKYEGKISLGSMLAFHQMHLMYVQKCLYSNSMENPE